MGQANRSTEELPMKANQRGEMTSRRVDLLSLVILQRNDLLVPLLRLVRQCLSQNITGQRRWLFGNSKAESQRDSGSKPKVARNELPWVTARWVFNPNGVAARCPDRAATPLGLLVCGPGSQGSSFLATLGFAPESPWDSATKFPKGIRVGCIRASFMFTSCDACDLSARLGRPRPSADAGCRRA